MTTDAHILTGLSNEEYHRHPAIGSSLAKLVLQSPQHYLDAVSGVAERRQTAAMATGTLIHRLLLEPESYTEIRTDADRPINGKTGEPYGTGTKAYQEWYAEQDAAGIVIAPEWVHALIDRIPKQVRTILNSDGLREHSVFATLNGLEVKCRPDLWLDTGCIVDLKTIRNLDAIDSQFFRLAYHFQACWYEAVASRTTRKVAPGAATYLFVETAAPYRWRIVDLDWETYDLGKRAVEQALTTLRALQDGTLDPAEAESAHLYHTVSPPSWLTQHDGDDDADADDAEGATL